MAIAAGALVMIAAALLLGRAASRHAWAPLLAALGLAANPRFFMFARRILVDVLLAALMTLILLCFALAERYPAQRKPLLLAMYVCVGLGLLAKGPVAALLPAIVFTIYLLAYGEIGRIREMMIPTGVLIALAIAAPWYVAVYADSGWTHITGFFIGENLERYTSLVGPQSRGPLFYLPVIVTDSLPWSLFLPAVLASWLADRRARPRDPDLRVRTLLLLWIVVIVGFFSLSQTKQDLYIFPIVAAVAALGGDLVARALSEPAPQGAERVEWVTLLVSSALLVAAGGSILYVFGPGGTYDLDGAAIAGWLAIAGGILVAGAVVRRRLLAAVAVLLTVLIAFNWTLSLRVLPSFEKYKPVPALSEAIRERVREGDLVAHFDVALPSMVFYLRRHIDVLFEKDAFVRTMRSASTVFAVLPEHQYGELEDELGMPTCVLARRPTADVKLREILSFQPPPAVVLVSTRCHP
jgi:4-amino-4-deoxy-L-arabinose transferase-like glycosyltransferase